MPGLGVLLVRRVRHSLADEHTGKRTRVLPLFVRRLGVLWAWEIPKETSSLERVLEERPLQGSIVSEYRVN